MLKAVGLGDFKCCFAIVKIVFAIIKGNEEEQRTSFAILLCGILIFLLL